MSTKGQRTRERLLDTATHLLIERGYHQVSLDLIAREAGISRQALHRWHFRTKAELLLALVRRVDEVVGVPVGLAAYRAAADGLAAIIAAAHMQAEMEPRIYPLAQVLYSARDSDPDARAAWDDRVRSRQAEAIDLAHRLRREGLLHEGWSEEEAGDLIALIFSVHVHEYLVSERGWSAERFGRRMAEVLTAALVGPGRPRPGTSG
jgi:AcrR family transcriptional regulator